MGKWRRRAEEMRQEMLKLMREQLSMQRGALDTVQGGVSQYLSPEGVGFNPEELAAMRGEAMEDVDTQFGGIESALKTMLARRGAAGGGVPISGDFLRGTGNLAADKVKLRAGLLRDVTVKNALLKLQNRFAAANSMLGVGSQYNPAPFLGGAQAALGTGANLAAQDQSFWESMQGGLAGGLTRGIFGGLSKISKGWFG